MIHSYPWYPSDWRSSQDVLALSAEARDIYRNLLDVCWMDGSLPANDRSLQKLSLADVREFKRSWPKIKHLFVIDGDRLHHPKVDERRPELLQWHENKRRAGRVGGTKRWQSHSRAIAQPLADSTPPAMDLLMGASRPSASTSSTTSIESVVLTTERSGSNEATPPSPPTTTDFDAAWLMYTSTGKPVNERDRERAAREWITQGCDFCVDSVLEALNDYLTGCADLIRNREWRKIADLARWLGRRPWTRRPVEQPEVPQSPPDPVCELCGGYGYTKKPGAPPEPTEGGWSTWADQWAIECACRSVRAPIAAEVDA